MPNSPFDETDPPDASEPSALALSSPQRGWVPPPPSGIGPEKLAPLPPLRLHHLFALTAVVAVILGINGPQRMGDSGDFNFPRWWQILMVGWGILYTILTAVAVTFVAYGIAWRRRGIRFFHQPGHWLLVDISVGSLLMVAAQAMSRVVQSLIDPEHGPHSMLIYWLPTLAVYGGMFGRMVFQIYLGIKKCREPRWKWVFFTKSIANVLQVLGDLVVLLLLLRAIRVDRREHSQHDAGHYCGVWLQIVLCALWVMFVIIFVGGLFSL